MPRFQNSPSRNRAHENKQKAKRQNKRKRQHPALLFVCPCPCVCNATLYTESVLPANVWKSVKTVCVAASTSGVNEVFCTTVHTGRSQPVRKRLWPRKTLVAPTLFATLCRIELAAIRGECLPPRNNLQSADVNPTELLTMKPAPACIAVVLRALMRQAAFRSGVSQVGLTCSTFCRFGVF